MARSIEAPAGGGGDDDRAPRLLVSAATRGDLDLGRVDRARRAANGWWNDDEADDRGWNDPPYPAGSSSRTARAVHQRSRERATVAVRVVIARRGVISSGQRLAAGISIEYLEPRHCRPGEVAGDRVGGADVRCSSARAPRDRRRTGGRASGREICEPRASTPRRGGSLPR
jgi:hypothetical protein